MRCVPLASPWIILLTSIRVKWCDVFAYLKVLKKISFDGSFIVKKQAEVIAFNDIEYQCDLISLESCLDCHSHERRQKFFWNIFPCGRTWQKWNI